MTIVELARLLKLANERFGIRNWVQVDVRFNPADYGTWAAGEPLHVGRLLEMNVIVDPSIPLGFLRVEYDRQLVHQGDVVRVRNWLPHDPSDSTPGRPAWHFLDNPELD